ncbi:collagen alpha-2(I) chain-like [Rissa tridactyla]|uniref:collagen alpha-2(I) chain-like n=1 Tax=Rissa tridactyla TaxID=75485 RepID=UPI0023BB047B|nr:collagen alpha-2(I) chain-like [Rissa tridactyla]
MQPSWGGDVPELGHPLGAAPELGPPPAAMQPSWGGCTGAGTPLRGMQPSTRGMCKSCDPPQGLQPSSGGCTRADPEGSIGVGTPPGALLALAPEGSGPPPGGMRQLRDPPGAAPALGTLPGAPWAPASPWGHQRLGGSGSSGTRDPPGPPPDALGPLCYLWDHQMWDPGSPWLQDLGDIGSETLGTTVLGTLGTSAPRAWRPPAPGPQGLPAWGHRLQDPGDYHLGDLGDIASALGPWGPPGPGPQGLPAWGHHLWDLGVHQLWDLMDCHVGDFGDIGSGTLRSSVWETLGTSAPGPWGPPSWGHQLWELGDVFAGTLGSPSSQMGGSVSPLSRPPPPPPPPPTVAFPSGV